MPNCGTEPLHIHHLRDGKLTAAFPGVTGMLAERPQGLACSPAAP